MLRSLDGYTNVCTNKEKFYAEVPWRIHKFMHFSFMYYLNMVLYCPLPPPPSPLTPSPPPLLYPFPPHTYHLHTLTWITIALLLMCSRRHLIIFALTQCWIMTIFARTLSLSSSCNACFWASRMNTWGSVITSKLQWSKVISERSQVIPKWFQVIPEWSQLIPKWSLKWSLNDLKWSQNDLNWSPDVLKWSLNDLKWSQNDLKWSLNDLKWSLNDLNWYPNGPQWSQAITKWSLNDGFSFLLWGGYCNEFKYHLRMYYKVILKYLFVKTTAYHQVVVWAEATNVPKLPQYSTAEDPHDG